MRSPSSKHQAPYRRLAAKAGKPRALINAMLQLEEAALPIGVNIIAHRGPAQPYRVSKNLTQSQPQCFELRPRQPSCQPPWPNASAKQALVGVDVAHP